MKIAKTKRMALLLALSFCMALAACGGGGAPAPAASADSSAPSASSPAADAVPAAAGVSFPLAETLKLTWMTRETSQQKMEMDAPVIRYIREELNVDIELQVIPEADYATKRSTVFASNSLPDVLDNCDSTEVMKYAPTGMLLCVEDYRDYAADYLNLVEAPDRAVETNKFRVDGKLYSFRTLEYDRIALAPINLIRIDLLEEQNIPMPTTWQEFYDALLKIKEKHPDMYGFGVRNGTNYLLGQYAYSLGTGGFPTFSRTRGMYYEPYEDEYVYGPTSEKFTRVVEFMANAYRDGLLDPDYATMNRDIMVERLTTGKLMSVCDNNSFAGRIYNPAIKEVIPGAYFDLVPPLADQDGKIRNLRYERDWGSAAVVSVKVKEPEKTVALISWLYSDEALMPTNFGREGIDYDMVEGIPMIKQEIVDRCMSAPDPFMAIQGELGVGLHGFGRYIDEKTHIQVSDPIFIEQGKVIAKWTDEGLLHYLPNWPPFTGEEASRITELEQALGNVFDQEIDKFITGKASVESEWPALVESLKKQGSEELEKIFNDAYGRIK